ncbi:hypothetical protein L1987_71165 [Smallanthus sonchifolius]|uniref:Uncharacterized protein n=1 Tax=Smallanthus sonchifolius TaxID=185202 RepID=A0ACB9ASI8_9ASTR|nr:hypothetical protein L1987_71165 [Smallanthus sonchifolius]
MSYTVLYSGSLTLILAIITTHPPSPREIFSNSNSFLDLFQIKGFLCSVLQETRSDIPTILLFNNRRRKCCG